MSPVYLAWYTLAVTSNTYSMESIQKLAVPIAIVIAGAMIAIAIYLVNGNSNQNNSLTGTTVAQEIRGVQEDDHILGNPNADIVVVEYSDTECPYCKQFHTTMHQIIDEYGADGSVAWVYRHFPIPELHAKAPKEAEALECAAEQGGNDMFWKYTNWIYDNTPSNDGLDIGIYNPPGETTTRTGAGQLTEAAAALKLNTEQFESCLASGKYKEKVDRDIAEVVASGGRGTPHNIFIVDGEQIPVEGAQPYEVMKGLMDTLLK
jgi:protein-disulfide isomerase